MGMNAVTSESLAFQDRRGQVSFTTKHGKINNFVMLLLGC